MQSQGPWAAVECRARWRCSRMTGRIDEEAHAAFCRSERAIVRWVCL